MRLPRAFFCYHKPGLALGVGVVRWADKCAWELIPYKHHQPPLVGQRRGGWVPWFSDLKILESTPHCLPQLHTWTVQAGEGPWLVIYVFASSSLPSISLLVFLLPTLNKPFVWRYPGRTLWDNVSSEFQFCEWYLAVWIYISLSNKAEHIFTHLNIFFTAFPWLYILLLVSSIPIKSPH